MSNEIVFSEDRTAFAIKTDHGIYINATGQMIKPPDENSDKEARNG